MREVFLDDLPRWGKYTSTDRINWKDSVGCKVKFIYDDIEGEIEVIDYIIKKQRLNIRYGNKDFSIKTINFSKCRLGELLGTHTKKYKYNIGEIIQTKNGQIEKL